MRKSLCRNGRLFDIPCSVYCFAGHHLLLRFNRRHKWRWKQAGNYRWDSIYIISQWVVAGLTVPFLQLHIFLFSQARAHRVMSRVCKITLKICSIFRATVINMTFLEIANRSSNGNSSGVTSYITTASTDITITRSIRIYLIIFLVIFTGMVFGVFCCCVANTSSKCWSRLRSNHMLPMYAAFTRLPTVTGKSGKFERRLGTIPLYILWGWFTYCEGARIKVR